MSSSEKKPPADAKPAEEEAAGVPHHPHVLAGAAALSGAVAGAIVGSVAGPVGAIAGGAIGTAIGAVGGAALEKQAHRDDQHDHELDDDIGVTKGSLGVPDEAKRPSIAPDEEGEV